MLAQHLCLPEGVKEDKHIVGADAEHDEEHQRVERVIVLDLHPLCMRVACTFPMWHTLSCVQRREIYGSKQTERSRANTP